jgi:tetratricopeptide (TPR) repeat protein
VFKRTDDDIYALPGLVASAILDEFETQTRLDSGRDAVHAPTPDAYRRYLHGKARLREGTKVALDRAMDDFEAAVRLDPQFAEAWGTMALTRLNIMLIEPGAEATGFRNRDPEERLSKARAEALQALALDAEQMEALLSLAIIDYRARLMPLAEAERRFQELAERAPWRPEVQIRAGMMYNELGLYGESLGYFERAFNLDPLSLRAGCFYLQALQQTGQFKEAQRFSEEDLVRGYHDLYIRLESLLENGDFEGARRWLTNAREATGFGSHGVYGDDGEFGIETRPLYGFLERLVDQAERSDPDPALASALVQAADDGHVLHYYVALLLGAAGFEAPVFELVKQRLAVDDLYIRTALFRSSLARVREDPEIMQWFDTSGHLAYWRDGGRWPDFCRSGELPYDCQEAVTRRYAALAGNAVQPGFARGIEGSR